MKVLITGDSHTGSLHRGLLSLQSTGTAQDFKVAPLSAGLLMNQRFFEVRDGYVEITIDDKINQVSRLPVDPSEALYDWYGLSAPLHVQPIVLDRFFYGHSPQPFTSALVKRLVIDRKKHSLELAAILKQFGAKIFVIEPPRTFSHHPKLPQNLSRVAMMEELCRGVILEELSRLEIPVVRIPGQALRDDGLMGDEFRHEHPDDRHHGNSAYGAMMINEAQRLIAALI